LKWERFHLRSELTDKKNKHLGTKIKHTRNENGQNFCQ
jgi:hypothetical protein